MSNMEYEYNESEEFKQVLFAKKERFRAEIRKTKNKEEFAMKRIKLMKDQEDSQSLTNQSSSPQQIFSNNQNNTLNQNIPNKKESFFSQFDNDSSNQNDNNVNAQQGDFIQDNNNCEKNNTSNSMSHHEKYVNYQDYEFMSNDIQMQLDEFKKQYRNGNRKILFDYLCSIRKKLTLALNDIEREAELQKNLSSRGNKNQFSSTMSLASNSVHPLFSIITQDKAFLVIILEILKISDYSHLKDIQNECMCILINICAGKNKECWVVLNMGILDTFKHIMENCTDLDILENVCWCLGNLAADDADCREKLFEDSSFIITVVQKFYDKIITKISAFPPNDHPISSNSQSSSMIADNIPQQELLSSNQKQSRFSIISELVFFLTNLIKKLPMPRLDPLRKILQILKELFFLDIPVVKIQIIKSFWVLLMKSEAYLKEILQLDLIRHIMPFLAGKNITLIKESIDLFYVIISNCDEYTRKLFVESKFQAYLEKALCNHNNEIKLKSIDLISKLIECSSGLNITAEILQQERLLFKLLELLFRDDFQVKIAILNLFKDFLQSDMGIQKMLKHDYIQILIRLGRCGCTQIEKLILESLDLIFEYGESLHNYESSNEHYENENSIMAIFFQHSGESLLEHLQNGKSEQIYQLCLDIIQKYISD